MDANTSLNILALVLARVKSRFHHKLFRIQPPIKSSQAPSLERGFSEFCSAGGPMQWISINACERRDSTPTCISYTEPASAKTCRSSRELIFKRGSGKRRQGEREFEAIPNPWPGPRGSDFGARPSTGSAESDCSRLHSGLQGPTYTGAGWESYCGSRSADSGLEWGLLEPRRATPADTGDGIKASGASPPVAGSCH